MFNGFLEIAHFFFFGVGTDCQRDFTPLESVTLKGFFQPGPLISFLGDRFGPDLEGPIPKSLIFSSAKVTLNLFGDRRVMGELFDESYTDYARP